MADTEAITVNDDIGGGDAPIVAAPVKGKKIKAAATDKGTVAKKPKTKPNHPPTSEMVQNAIKSLKERGGSSLQAIKKYISATYKIDADKLSPFIKKYIKSAVIGGQLVQTKGKGASGSFRLPTAAKPKQPKKSTAAAATSKPKTVKKSTTKSSAEDKKPKAVVKKESTIRKPVPPTKKPVEEKKKVVVPVKVAKKADVKATTKQKPTKPVKSDAAKKPKTPKPKKASTGAAAKKAKK